MHEMYKKSKFVGVKKNVYVCMYVCMCVCVYIYIYIYIYIYMNGGNKN